MARTDGRLVLLSPGDNVVVARCAIEAGAPLLIEGRRVVLADPVGMGHKLARTAMAPGDKVIKHGAPIGSAAAPIAAGDHVHLHNIRSDYIPTRIGSVGEGGTA